MSFAILRISKLKTWGNIGGSLAHNFREIKTPNADPTLTILNEHSLDTSQKIKNLINNRLPEKRRSDAVLCIEHLITASPEWSGWGTSRENAFFEKSIEWLKAKYGSENVIATTIHRDETTPHLVAYVVPLDPATGRLNAKKWLGGKKLLSEMQSGFANQVKSFGLDRGIENSKANHKTIQKYYSEINLTAKTAVEPFSTIPAIPDKGFFEGGVDYGQRVMDVVYQHVQADVLQLQKENFELKKQVEGLKQELGKYKYFEREFEPYREYCKVFPDERIRLNAKFRDAAKKEIEEREYRKIRASEFDEIYKDFDEPNLNKYIKKQRKEYVFNNLNAYTEILAEKYNFIQSEIEKGDFFQNSGVFDRDLKLEPVDFSVNAKLIKNTKILNDQAEKQFLEEQRKKRAYSYSIEPTKPSLNSDLDLNM